MTGEGPRLPVEPRAFTDAPYWPAFAAAAAKTGR
jgi:hypothetical protein